MSSHIFFSWQSDTENRTGRSFLMDTLQRVCKDVAKDTSIEEAQRNISVDSDTKGAAGRPPIVDTIFKKIDECKVYVADVTFVGKRTDGRLIPNPNVLIEYGWALKSKTHERVITVMNTAYGEPSETSLPFNMRHVVWPIVYNLPTGATEEEKAAARNTLTKDLVSVVKASLAIIPKVPSEIPDAFTLTEAKNGPARFRAKNQSLGFSDSPAHENWKEIFLTESPEIWLRVFPNKALKKEWPIHELKEMLRQKNNNLLPLFNRTGYSFLIAEDGVGVYSTTPEKVGQEIAEAVGVGFVFTSSEIWSIDTILMSYPRNLYQSEIEQSFALSLKKYSHFLSGLDIQGPYCWIAGIRGTKGRNLKYPPPPGKSWLGDHSPICMTDTIEVQGVYDPAKQTATEALLPFFHKIFEKCALARPDYLPQK